MELIGMIPTKATYTFMKIFSRAVMNAIMTGVLTGAEFRAQCMQALRSKKGVACPPEMSHLATSHSDVQV
jgi:hypothetical protein